jgi:hypothetical protein
MDGRGSNPGEDKRFPFLQNLPHKSQVHPVTYTMGDGFFPKEKRTEPEGDLSHPYSAKVMNEWN